MLLIERRRSRRVLRDVCTKDPPMIVMVKSGEHRSGEPRSESVCHRRWGFVKGNRQRNAEGIDPLKLVQGVANVGGGQPRARAPTGLSPSVSCDKRGAN